MTGDKINLKDSFLIEDGESIHVFLDGDYKGILDMSLYNQALEDVKKTIRLPTEPQLNIFLFSDEEFDELPPEIEYYDENIQSLYYKGDEELEKVFRNIPLSDSQNPPISILVIKGAAALTGLVLSEGIKNKMKNRGMLPREVSRSQPKEISAEIEPDYMEESYGYGGDEYRENPPSDPPSGSIEEDFRYTKEHAPRVWEAITHEPWTYEDGLPKNIRQDMLDGNDFNQNMIDAVEEIVDVGVSASSVAASAAKKIWDFLYATNLLIWSRPRDEPGSIDEPVDPGETADYWLAEGIGVEGQRTRVSKSEWYGDTPYRNIIPHGTPVALKDYTVRMLSPDGHPSEQGVEDYMEGERLDPNKLEIGVVVDILDFGGFFFPSLVTSQNALGRTEPKSLFVGRGGIATDKLNNEFERPESWYGYVHKTDGEIQHYQHYVKRSDRTEENMEFTQDYSDNYWVDLVTGEYRQSGSALVNKPPLKLDEKYKTTGGEGFSGITNTEYCVIRVDLNEMEDHFGLGIFDTENFEGKFAFVLPRTIVNMDVTSVYPYMDVEVTQSVKKFNFTGIHPWDKSVDEYDEDADGWTDDYGAKISSPRDFITWFYLKYGMVATRRGGDVGNPAVPHSMINIDLDIGEVESYAETTTRVSLENPSRNVIVKDVNEMWTDDDGDIYGLFFNEDEARSSMHDDNGELFFRPEYDGKNWDVYPGPEVAHWKSRNNRGRMVNLLNEIGAASAAPTPDVVDTKVDKHPEPPTAEPEEPEEEPESEPEEPPTDIADEIDADIEDLAPGEDVVDYVEVEDAPQPNLTYIETSDGGGIDSGLYPFPFADVDDIHACLVSDVWTFTSWDEDDISDGRPDTGYLDSLFANDGVEYLFLVNLGEEDISYQRHKTEYDEIEDEEWISKFKDFLDYDGDEYILISYTSKMLSDDMYSVGGTYYPKEGPTHVLVEDEDRTDDNTFAWKLAPIQSADSIYLFDRDDRAERKLYKDVKGLHEEGSPNFDDSITRDKFMGIAAVGEGAERYVELFGDVSDKGLEKWKNWKEALMEKLDYASDLSNKPCIMFRVNPEYDEWYEGPDMSDDELRDRFFEELRRNPPVDMSGSYSMSVEKEPDLLDRIDKVKELPREEIPYNPKEDEIPRIPRDTLTNRPIFHHPEEPVKVKGEGAGDEPGASKRVEEPEEEYEDYTDIPFDEDVVERWDFDMVRMNPDEDDEISKALSMIKRDVDTLEQRGKARRDRVEVYQRPFEPSLEPDAHFEKIDAIDDVLDSVFAFPDEITRAMVICSALNEDWVTLLKGIPGTGKTVLAHLIMMSFMNDIDFQTDEVNVSKLYTDDVVSNYLQKVDVWGVTKHNQDKQPDDVFYETEIRMTESLAPEEGLMVHADKYEKIVDYVSEIEDIHNWRDKLRDEGYDDDDIKKIEAIQEKLDEWEELPEGELDYIESSYEWLTTRFEESIDGATPLDELVVRDEGVGVVDDLRENIPKDIERQLERVRGRTRLSSVRDYVFDPKRKPIVESLIKYHNEANRANPNVADTMLGLIAEKQVEYLGKPLSSPVYGQKFPCLHYLDYNPHLDMREDQELDRALLDRANMGIYLRQADFRGREKILEGKYGIDWDERGDASSKSVEEQLIDAAIRGIDADDGFQPLSYLELQEVWNVVDQIPLTDQQIMLINIITQHFSMLYKKYDSKAYDVINVQENLISDNFVEELNKKRRRFFSKRDADLIDEDEDKWQANFVDTSTIAYIDAKQQAGDDIGGGTGAETFNKAGLINQVDRELGLRSAESLVRLLKAYAYYVAAKKSVRDDSFEVNDMSDFQDVIEDEWIPLLLSYVIEHRINIGVMDTLQTKYFNFGDFVDGWYLPQVLIGKGDEDTPPLWVKWKIWTQCAHPQVSANQKELIENVLEVVEDMKDSLDNDDPLHEKLEAYSTKDALFRDVDGGSAEPTIQAIYNSVARNR